MDNRKFTYKELRSRQKEDLRKKRIANSVQRNFSTLLTYIFVKLGISANTVTISNFFLCILGYIFLSIGTYPSLIIGLLIFNLYMTFDFTDGEVARIRNQVSLEGPYFDEVGHYLYPICLGAGLGYGLHKLYNSEIYIILGLVYIIVFVMEYSIVYASQSLVRKGIINHKKVIDSDGELQKNFWDYVYERRSWAKRNIFLKLAGIYPFQGLIYSPFLISPILLILILIDFFLSIYTIFPVSFYGYAIRIVPIYLFIVCVSKFIWIAIFIYKMEKNRYFTNFLNKY